MQRMHGATQVRPCFSPTYTAHALPAPPGYTTGRKLEAATIGAVLAAIIAFVRLNVTGDAFSHWLIKSFHQLAGESLTFKLFSTALLPMR